MTWFYIILIVLTIGGMIAHNILDFMPKFKAHYRRYREKAKEVRFTKSERIQHTILTASFIILAYTGFALRFPRAWWAMPFAMWGNGFDWRGVIHRTMAVIFSGLVVYHACYLFFTKRGKEQLKALMPKWRDFLDLFKMTKYNLGIDKKKPAFERYNYVEKAEYWALVWGSVIMLVTGSMLTFEDFFLRYFPKWVLDVARTIHYYEAVLAVLAVIVWPLYFTIFDPEHYPLDLSIMTGKASKKHTKENDDAPKS